MDNEARISALEEAMSSVRADLAVIRSNYATKADVQQVAAGVQEVRGELHATKIELEAEIRFAIEKLRAELQKEMHALTWRMYGYGLVLVAAVHFVDRYGY